MKIELYHLYRSKLKNYVPYKEYDYSYMCIGWRADDKVKLMTLSKAIVDDPRLGEEIYLSDFHEEETQPVIRAIFEKVLLEE